MSGFGNIQPRTGNKDSVRLEEVIKLHKWPADEWSQVRFLPGKILPVKRHWISIIAGKDKKEITIPRYCLAFDVNNENAPRMMPNPNYKKGSSKKSEKEKMIPVPCPYCTLAHGQDTSARYEFFYLANAIIREVQEDMPARAKKIERTKEEKKTGHKDIRSKSWTPVEVCRITSTVANRIKELGDGNFAKDKKTKEKVAYDATHEKYGIDIRVKFKPKGAGSDKYSADKDERTPLTDDEKGYLTWKLDESLIEVTGRMELPQALEDFKRMEVVGADTVDDDSEGYSLGDDDGKKKKKGDKKKKSAAFDDDDDEPKSKKKGKKSKSDDDDDDDEDDEPKSKKKGKTKAAFEDDDDDEDDEPKKKKKSSGDKKSSKSKDKVKSKKSKSDDAPAKKKKKAKDEDDEPVKKKKKSSDDGKKSKSKDKKADKASSKKKGKKSASAWDDDDE